MKLQVKDLYNLQEALTSLLDKEMDVAIAFKVQSNYKKVATEMENSDAVRKKVLNKYNNAPDGEQFRVKQGDEEKFKKEFDELMSQDVEVELKTIALSELSGSMKPKTLALLDKIIKEVE